MNFFSRICFLFTIFICSNTFAIDLNSVYLSSCHREVGIITDVSGSSVTIFNVKGQVVKVPRYEIIGLASYPLDKFPVKGIRSKKQKIKLFTVNTLFKNKLTELVIGWPIRFSKEKLTFLSVHGEEVTFARSNIWEIFEIPSKDSYKFKRTRNQKYDFLHPTSLSKCSKRLYGKSKKIVRVSPQEFISDPITLKRKFDKFITDLKTIDMYTRSQSFYAIPEVYKNQTTLGLWTYAGSRHGSSHNRANNWTPILENQFSSGPFGYQHVFTTGANTNDYFVHEEPQTQIFYSFKADYFHLGYYLDPTLVLMGKRYRWFEDELGQDEYRVNDMSFVELGFDFGHWSLLMQVSSEVQLGYEDIEGYFFDGSLTIPKYGLSYQNHIFYGNFLLGTTSENVRSDDIKDGSGNVIGFKISEMDLDFLRVNFGQHLNSKWSYKLSYIQRNFSADKRTTETTTLSNELEYKYSYKYILKSLFSAEQVKSEEKDYTFLKLGLSGNLVF